MLPEDMTGMSILDIGCADGFFSLECAKRGAARVVSIDRSEKRISNLSFAAQCLEISTIEARTMSLYHLDTTERFDLVLMLGVLYHLDHPLVGLEKISKVTDRLLLETAVSTDREDSSMVWGRSIGYSDGWLPTKACVFDMLRACGFTKWTEGTRRSPKRMTLLCTKS